MRQVTGMSYTGMENDDSLSTGGRELGEEAAQLDAQARSLFNAMEDEVQDAMKGSSPQALLNAHSDLNGSFTQMVLWLDDIGIKLGDANSEILEADFESGAAIDAAGAEAAGIPSING
ncbi:hypothetical protein GCM10028793_43590 [Nocardiopsis oceani]